QSFPLEKVKCRTLWKGPNQQPFPNTRKEYGAVVQFVWVGQPFAGQAVFATGGGINPSERRG
ncbi:hypothetical protein, partial [Pseudomonas helleri]